MPTDPVQTAFDALGEPLSPHAQAAVLQRLEAVYRDALVTGREGARLDLSEDTMVDLSTMPTPSPVTRRPIRKWAAIVGAAAAVVALVVVVTRPGDDSQEPTSTTLAPGSFSIDFDAGGVEQAVASELDIDAATLLGNVTGDLDGSWRAVVAEMGPLNRWQQPARISVAEIVGTVGECGTGRLFIRTIGDHTAFRWEVVPQWADAAMARVAGGGAGTYSDGRGSSHFDGVLTCTADPSRPVTNSLIASFVEQRPSGTEELTASDLVHADLAASGPTFPPLISIPSARGGDEALAAVTIRMRTPAGPVYPQVYLGRAEGLIQLPDWTGLIAVPVDACGGMTVTAEGVGHGDPESLTLSPGQLTGSVRWSKTGAQAPADETVLPEDWHRIGLSGWIRCP